MARLGANYWRLFSASVVSNLGDGIAGIAYPWLASLVTRDPILLSLTVVASRIPWLLFTLPAGVVTDRVDRRKLIAWMDVFRFLLTGGVAAAVAIGASSLPAADADPFVAPDNQVWWLVLVIGAAFLFGIAEVFRDNAAQTLMPAVVDTEHLEKANGRMWGAEATANSFVGPPLGGLLLGLTLALPFFVDAGTFLLSALLIFSLKGSFKARHEGPPVEPEPFLTEIKIGIKWLFANKLLRDLGIVLGVMNAMLQVSFATSVFFVQEVLELDAAAFGVLMTGGAAGAVIGSLLASKVSERLGSGTALLITLGGSALTLAAIGMSSSWPIVWAMFAINSFLAVVWNVITVALRQTIIPDQLLGRVNSVYRFFAWGMMPIGGLLGGVIVALAEPGLGRIPALRIPFFVAGGVYAVLFAIGIRRFSTERIETARAAVQ
ncbi:MAG: MFS transporter [Acidimicrobiia bacterium]|nr:MFS transporter [Acidimicrobiia bacterium]